jgi:molybdopterin-synthase adenylyltransferase
VVDVTCANIEDLAAGADLVLDGTDNFATRYLINDLCVQRGIPWVYGGVLASYGVTMTIVPGKTPCLRCLFAEMPPVAATPTTATAGILGPIVRVIASFEVAEAMKLISGRGKLNAGLITIDVWDNRLESLAVARQEGRCPACGQRRFDFLRPQ